MKFKINAQKNIIEEGQYVGIITKIIGVGTQQSSYNGATSLFIEITVLNESNEIKDKIYNLYYADMSLNSRLRKDLATWRGRDFTNTELTNFTIFNILKKSLKIDIIHNVSRAGRIFPFATNFQAYTHEDGIREELEYSIIDVEDPENFDFEIFNSLPQNVKKLITDSKEFASISRPAIDPFQDVDQEDLPF